MNLVAQLGRIPPFNQLDGPQLQSLAEVARVQTYAEGQRIIQAGERGDAIYVALEGSVQVRQGDEARNIAWLPEGEVFGEMALITGNRREADVIADEDTVCAILDKKPLYALCRANPGVAAFLTELVGRRLVDGRQITRVGKYRVLQELGRGGMAIVYAGVHPQLRRPVAIKMLKHDMVFDEGFAKMFADEAQIVARLDHPNIVRVFDHEAAYATQFIVMEMVEGVTLTELMRTQPQMDEATVRRVILQLASALEYAHRAGIVHRDVKPDNVMSAPGRPVKLMDFGIAHPSAQAVEEIDLIGSGPYMAPEQRRAGSVDGRADIYALGVMAFEMLTNALPESESETLPDVRSDRPGVSAQMAEFIACATAREPADRFATCGLIHEHFGVGFRLVRAGACAQTVTLIYDPREQVRVRDALDRLTADLADRDVLVSIARHPPLDS